MTFVSYAQNFEDVILWRALAPFGPGFYIDVGAAEPVADSVTAAFYERGWRGINIEPMKAAFERLRAARPEDTNLQVAIEDRVGEARYFSVDDGNGLSTGVEAFAQDYGAQARAVEPVTVAVTTLAEVCRRHVGARTIHFLKVDVEGKEAQVLRGADFEAYRPWIVVVEATKPNTQQPTHAEWEGILTGARYRLAYFDGLNRFYVSEEMAERLGPALAAPPNWFDHFVRHSEAQADERARRAEARAAQAEQALAEATEAARAAEATQAAAALERGAHAQTRAALERLEQAHAQACASIEALRGENARLLASQEALTFERDLCYQEIFESSRHAAWLSQERFALQGRAAQAQAELDQARQAHAGVAQQLDACQQQSEALRQHNDALRQHGEALRLRSETLHARIEALLSSTSWRITRPVRAVKLLLRGGSGR